MNIAKVGFHRRFVSEFFFTNGTLKLWFHSTFERNMPLEIIISV